jgi:hypothetical protein
VRGAKLVPLMIDAEFGESKLGRGAVQFTPNTIDLKRNWVLF